MVVRYIADCWIRIVRVARFAALTTFSVPDMPIHVIIIMLPV